MITIPVLELYFTSCYLHAGLWEGGPRKLPRGPPMMVCEDLLLQAMEFFDLESERHKQSRGHKWNLVTEYYNKYLPKSMTMQTKTQLQGANKRRLAKLSKRSIIK